MRSRHPADPEERISEEIDDLRKGLAELGLSSRLARDFGIYLELLYEYRGRINLISDSDYQRISCRHFLVSLIGLPYLRDARRVADLGSGAGFPGLPLKIVMPEKEFVLIESMKKRARFLVNLIQSLSTKRVSVFCGRAEDHPENYFDAILLRAAGRIKDKIRVIDRLLELGGRAIFYKGSSAATEIHEARTLIDRFGYTLKVEPHLTPVERRPLNLVILKKTAGTTLTAKG